MDIKYTWTQFKSIVNTNSLVINYADANGNYYLYAISSLPSVSLMVCVLDKESTEATEFEEDYMPAGILLT